MYMGNHICEVDLYQSLVTFARRNNLEHFIMFKLPNSQNTRLSDVTLCSNWPTYLFKQFDELKMLQTFPVWREFYNNVDQVQYDIDLLLRHASNVEAQRILELLKVSGLCHGVSLLLETEKGQQGIILYTSQSPSIDTKKLENIRAYSAEIFKDFIALDQYNSVKSVRLSKREYECVSWTSQGKTSYEIGMILGLSENTINNYLVAASRKLGAVNRAHMVAKALRDNIIS